MKAFDRFDKNQDKTLQRDELLSLATVFAQLGGLDLASKGEDEKKAALDETLALFDTNGDGSLTREEFADAFLKMSEITTETDFKGQTAESFEQALKDGVPSLFGDAAPAAAEEAAPSEAAPAAAPEAAPEAAQ